MYYSTDGGFTAWFPKQIANRFFRHVYNRALNTPTTTTTTTTAAPVPYTIDSFGAGSSFDACTYGSPSITIYALPGYTTPIVTMIFYDSSSLTTPYVGGAGWRKFTNGVTNYAGEVDVNGELTNYVTC